MRSLIILILLFLGQQLVAQTDSMAIYNKLLTPAVMKQDLDIFLDIRKKANSGLYRYRTQKQIDSIYKWAYAKTRKPMTTLDFYHIILELTDFEGSCHNYTEVPAELTGYLNRSKGFFPYALKYIDGKMIFNSKGAPIPVGSRVVSINGVSDKNLMKSFYKYMPADGYTITEKLSGSVDRSYGMRYLLEYGVKDKFTIGYTGPGSNKLQTVTVPAVGLEQRKKAYEQRHSAPVDSIIDWAVQPNYSFRMVNAKTGLLSFRVFNMADDANDPRFAVYVKFIDSVFNLLSQQAIPNLILDIRGNPGGSDPTYEQPMMYLTDSSFKENTSAYIIFDEIVYPQYFYGISTNHRMDSTEREFGKAFLKDYFPALQDGRNKQNIKYNPVYHPKSPAYKGQLYLLIDEGVASAASHLASLVKAYARKVKIVGVETVGGYYGHNGHSPAVYELPNSKIKTKFSIVWVVQDAPVKPDQPEGRGIIPDHEVWPTYDDFMKNRDTQMEYVLKLIGS